MDKTIEELRAELAEAKAAMFEAWAKVKRIKAEIEQLEKDHD